MEWQPIETAPEEKRVLVCGPDGIDIGSFDVFYEHWMRDTTADYDNDYARITQPTHWMPLPDAA